MDAQQKYAGHPGQTDEWMEMRLKVRRDTALHFKQACADAAVDAGEEISRLMGGRCGMRLDTPDLLSVECRKHRRKAVNILLRCLEKILTAENEYIRNVPDNFQDTDNFANAELSAEAIEGAIGILEDAY